MKPIQALAFGRIAAGAGAFLAPTLSGPLMGVGGAADAHMAARLFGGRDFALGVATLLFEGDQRRGVIRAGIIADVLDVAAGALGVRQHTTPASKGVPLVALAVGAIVIAAGELRN
jgi:hypothetical protein